MYILLSIIFQYCICYYLFSNLKAPINDRDIL